MKTHLLLALVCTASAMAFRIAPADDAAPTAETRLRAALRDTMLQLRDAQNQVVIAQAAQAQSDKDKADLQAKLDALTVQLKTVTDQAAADKSASDSAIADLKAQVTDQTGQIARLNDGLKQWKDAYDQATQLATAKETARAQAVTQAALLQRTVDDRETKNLALFKLGNDILDRYEKFSFGDALSAKEPFIGTSRVKLENMVQDYKNKLLDQAVISGHATPAVPAPAPAPKQEKTTTSSPAKPVTST
jgi:chromosome segregation ATPase